MLLLAKVAIGASATLALAGAWVFHEGVIRVDVDESRSGGSHIHFLVPATTVSMGLRVTPRRYLQQAAAQTREYLPVLRQVSKELEKYPNAELLDVRSASDHACPDAERACRPAEWVHLAMHNGKLYIDVVDGTDNVHISFPAETLRDVADRLEDLAPAI